MNDLVRPLIQRLQEIIPVNGEALAETVWDIVGPVCETGDFLGKGRALKISKAIYWLYVIRRLYLP
jgi:diaminopimelate decarboxylase